MTALDDTPTTSDTDSDTVIKRSFCRICHAACPVNVHIEQQPGVHGSIDRVVKVTGVDEDPLFNGYTCIKGRQIPDQIHHPARLRNAVEAQRRRQPRRDRQR